MLNVEGGTPPYTWAIVPPVDGWHVTADPSFNPTGSHAQLLGEQPGAPQISVEVTDATYANKTLTYVTTPRTACWFAYTALETDGPQLHVVDPLLPLTPALALAHNQGVHDFAFSPDGRYLAYRFAADTTNPEGKHLALVSLATSNDQQLAFAEDSIASFAWSADSSVLAVAFKVGTTSFLGGVRVGGDAKPLAPTPTPATLNSDLYWFGGSRVALYASGISDPLHPGQLKPNSARVTAFYAELGDGGFKPVTLSTDTSYALPVVLQPADDGFFLTSTSDASSQFNWIDETGATGNSIGNDFLAPSGRFTAEFSSGMLQLFSAEDDTLVAGTSGGQCPTLLSWATGQERIACVADLPADAQGKVHSDLRIFSLSDANNLSTLTVQGSCTKSAVSLSAASQCAALEYDYTQANEAQQPRIFSKTGDYFAFTTGSAGAAGSYLYWADLHASPFTLKKKDSSNVGGSSSSPTRIAFSPDAHYLLQQRGSSLSVHTKEDMLPAFLGNFYADPAQAALTCSEDFASAPDRWCGSATRTAPFQWSPDSKLVAYRSTDTKTGKKTLTVVDLAQFPGFQEYPVFAPDCDQKCSRQFAFQPQQ